MELFSTKEGFSFPGGVLHDRIQSEWIKFQRLFWTAMQEHYDEI